MFFIIIVYQSIIAFFYKSVYSVLMNELKYFDNLHHTLSLSKSYTVRRQIRHLNKMSTAAPRRPQLRKTLTDIHRMTAWILGRSATGSREADLSVFAKLFEDRLKWRLGAETFSRR